MFGIFLIEKDQPGPLGQNSSVTNSRRLSRIAHDHFQVNFKFRRYWSGNLVLDGDAWIPELRDCPFCHDHIEHDERGYPHCLTCGTIFPLPYEPLKMEKQRAYERRQFFKKMKEDGRNGRRTSGFKGASGAIEEPYPSRTRKSTRDCHRVVHKAAKSK